MELIFIWILSALILMLTAWLTPGFQLRSFASALAAIALIALLNVTISPVLIAITLPINVLTLGLFTFVIHALILRLSASVLPGLIIKGWGPAIAGAVVLTAIQILAFSLF